MNPANFVLGLLDANTSQSVNPADVKWNAASRIAVLDVTGLPAGLWQLEIANLSSG